MARCGALHGNVQNPFRAHRAYASRPTRLERAGPGLYLRYLRCSLYPYVAAAHAKCKKTPPETVVGGTVVGARGPLPWRAWFRSHTAL